MWVLRQTPIEILTPDLDCQLFGRPVTTPKPLYGRISMERILSSGSRIAARCHSRSVIPTPLFGPDIRDTSENRATIFRRFTDLWSLIAQASESAPSNTVACPPFDAKVRSPFECSMAIVKLCKTVGISLSPSAATHLSLWGTNEGVDFKSFCGFAIKGAIQPALHQFNLDNFMGEYISALDTILQSLVVTESTRYLKDTSTPPLYSRRMKEFNEIQPLFVSWKTGISPRLVQPTETPLHTTGMPTIAHFTAEKVRRAVEASVSQHKLANQLPCEEARVTHVANIRRKVQLHKSWRLSTESKFIKNKFSNPMTREALICCSCSLREAVLWCSSCFSVNCQKCWQEIHFCKVDLSIVSRRQLLGPTALAMTKKRSDNTMMRPPVPMIYLPTKVSAPGTLAKGNPTYRHSNPRRNISNKEPPKDEGSGVVSNTILPSLHKSRSDTTVFRHHAHLHDDSNFAAMTDSTTQFNSLMLLMPPSTPTRGNRSTMDSAMRQSKHHTLVRPNLHLASVLLDADLLLSNTPEQRR
ncbi:Conserved oligomeric Golgi complex subunit [Phytophthora megakarya]|uniref:Conserved oligomeric Golgi complex subunit n=1 Tax=Phytophthora megakarya TaxID=4795 RepID=A0A225VTQ1_9STRA|nr:Conserved oligomeric Golgi complex subunit [Phytophthora megakarya]